MDDAEEQGRSTRTARTRIDDVEVSLPFGKIRARGAQAPGFVVACAIAMVVLYTGYLYDEHRTVSEKKIDADHKELSVKLDEMVWVLSLPERERAQLNLSMPESLRYKINSGAHQR